MKDQNCHCA